MVTRVDAVIQWRIVGCRRGGIWLRIPRYGSPQESLQFALITILSTTINLTACVEGWEAWPIVGSNIVSSGALFKEGWPSTGQSAAEEALWCECGRWAGYESDSIWAESCALLTRRSVRITANDNTTYLSDVYDRFSTAPLPPPSCGSACSVV